MLIDIEEIWPSAKSLVALEFQSDEDYCRAWWLTVEQLDTFGWADEKRRIIAVRKNDKHLFSKAGFAFNEYAVVDEDSEPLTDEERAEYRAWMRELNARNVERLQRLDP